MPGAKRRADPAESTAKRAKTHQQCRLEGPAGTPLYSCNTWPSGNSPGGAEGLCEGGGEGGGGGGGGGVGSASAVDEASMEDAPQSPPRPRSRTQIIMPNYHQSDGLMAALGYDPPSSPDPFSDHGQGSPASEDPCLASQQMGIASAAFEGATDLSPAPAATSAADATRKSPSVRQERPVASERSGGGGRSALSQPSPTRAVGGSLQRAQLSGRAEVAQLRRCGRLQCAVMPLAAAWYHPGVVCCDVEVAAPELTAADNRWMFDGRSAEYIWVRDVLVDLYRAAPHRHLSFVAARRSVEGDDLSTHAVWLFLMRWGLINYRVPPTGVLAEVNPLATHYTQPRVPPEHSIPPDGDAASDASAASPLWTVGEEGQLLTSCIGARDVGGLLGRWRRDGLVEGDRRGAVEMLAHFAAMPLGVADEGRREGSGDTANGDDANPEASLLARVAALLAEAPGDVGSAALAAAGAPADTIGALTTGAAAAAALGTVQAQASLMAAHADAVLEQIAMQIVAHVTDKIRLSLAALQELRRPLQECLVRSPIQLLRVDQEHRRAERRLPSTGSTIRGANPTS
eukprot:TRINITY_DN3389_c1_g1_i1.p1 TRINITY_DN3389_c1_g1~~TRINITY_DN3389_c1_g1_i1.p1  ORF type:complete len:571 (+),score=22.09 TRINITY_DN3389_c1_g1_i1:196-1908(+)